MIALDAGVATVIAGAFGAFGLVFAAIFARGPAKRAEKASVQTRQHVKDGTAAMETALNGFGQRLEMVEGDIRRVEGILGLENIVVKHEKQGDVED